MESSLVELSVVMPCLNEAETLEACIVRIQQALLDHRITGEVIVADNGSTDGSVDIALRAGAIVVPVSAKGYGSAINGGVQAARGTYVIMGDADSSYDFYEIPVLLAKLREGSELVMGNRFKGGVKTGAMPFLHRYLGNPVLSYLGRLFYGIPIGDFHCGLRGFKRTAYHHWNLRTTGMEFASEMVVKAALSNTAIAEVPVTLSPDGRSRAPHLRTWQDGWRHLMFLLIHSPRWLFLIPGIALFTVGLFLFLLVLPQPLELGGFGLDIHSLLFGMTMMIAGFQATAIGVVSRIFAAKIGTKQTTRRIERLAAPKTINLLIFVGALLIIVGFFGFVYSVFFWEQRSFGGLDPRKMIRLVVPFMLCFLMGFQSVVTGFFISIVNLAKTVSQSETILIPMQQSDEETIVYS
jgi:glycosyltransferase involved in cell wall biosynthesis